MQEQESAELVFSCALEGGGEAISCVRTPDGKELFVLNGSSMDMDDGVIPTWEISFESFQEYWTERFLKHSFWPVFHVLWIADEYKQYAWSSVLKKQWEDARRPPERGFAMDEIHFARWREALHNGHHDHPEMAGLVRVDVSNVHGLETLRCFDLETVKLQSVQHLLNVIYTIALRDLLPRSSYGQRWVLHKTRASSWGHVERSTQSLHESGISSGEVLRVQLVEGQ